jgi:hypothetical protein
MKQLFIILGLVAAIATTILSVLPIFDLAIFPGIAALILASIAYYFSKKTGNVNKSIQFIFLLTIIALSLSIYKTFFNKSEIEANTEELIIKEETSTQAK